MFVNEVWRGTYRYAPVAIKKFPKVTEKVVQEITGEAKAWLSIQDHKNILR